MADESQDKVDKKIRQIERKINAVYGQAQVEIEEKISDFESKFEVKNDIYYQKWLKGDITREQYDSWWAGQMFQSNQWKAKRDQICGILHDANQQATNIVNGGTIGVFAEGANWTAYSLEHTAGVNFGFGLYDEYTVTNLIANDPQILPKWKIDEPKEYVWNKQKVNNCVTQGIIQGESLDKIAKRIATETSNQDKNLALTHARTAMTGAQNAGRVQRLQDARKMGINVVKEWMATLDGHTRDSHATIDGEKKPVGDTWHPMKFSNGCRYPGDPQGPAREVFNCRCTLVGDLEDYPEEYQRYDNIDGVPINNMTYKEWEKTKFPPKEDKKVVKLQKQAQTLQEQLDELNHKIEGEGADYVFEGIWKSGPKTYADWDEVKDSIPMKIEYYENQKQDVAMKLLREMGIDNPDDEAIQKVSDELIPLLRKYQHGMPDEFGEDTWKILQAWGCDDKDDVEEWIEAFGFVGGDKYSLADLRIKQLQMFQNFGEEYSQLLTDRDLLVKQLSDINTEIRGLTFVSPFGPDAYTEERKNAALWAKTSREADNALRPVTERVWQGMSPAERSAAYGYTSGSGGFNRPLRGYDESWYNFKGVGEVPLNNEHRGDAINAFTDAIERSVLEQDTWLQRGVDTKGLAGFLQIPESTLYNSSQEELESLLLGKVIADPAFFSCGSSKGKGFSGNILNVYCPEGTHAMYAEPFSAFGDGAGSGWDGKSPQSSFGYELETIVQRNTYYRISKVEKSYGKIYLDIEVVDQKPYEIKYP